MMFFNSTDLPVPDGPMMALISPRGTSKLMSSRTVCDPNDFVTPRREITPDAVGGSVGGSAGSVAFVDSARFLVSSDIFPWFPFPAGRSPGLHVGVSPW